MADNASRTDREGPANDNRAPDGQESEGKAKAKASGKFDAAVLSIARMIGRQMAREHFEAQQPANDNRSRGAADDD
ncbi:hypothetical protein PDO_2311 [Rhizobium sp. PDO1-076]|uniref:hypothetical protein n=1 Tax=Rhizobium sp. PDO1-076 TaxID=1125979 RepID=UPI00024E3B56|nr:hypothetical protein [Rhizobium sp. PDO1-076]EHS50665.1 hypothetical protein PDO_2311 [Rhizobium sp. PDO1-076]